MGDGLFRFLCVIAVLMLVFLIGIEFEVIVRISLQAGLL